MDDLERTRPAQRSGYGSEGYKLTLHANFFELCIPRGLLLYRYHIAFTYDEKTPEISKSLCSNLIMSMIEEHFSDYVGGIVTDGKQNIISKHKLLPGVYTTQQDRSSYELSLKLTGTLLMSDLLNQLETSGEVLPNTRYTPVEHIQALNIILGHYPKFSRHILSPTSNSHFALDTQRISLVAGLHILRGLSLTVRAAQTRLLCNARLVHTICHDECPLDYAMISFIRENGPNMAKLAGFLRGLRIEPTHLPRLRSGRARIKRIAGLAMPEDGDKNTHLPVISRFAAGPKDVLFYRESKAPASQAEVAVTENGSKKRKRAALEGMVSVYEYFRAVYGIEIQDSSLPVLNVGSPSNPSYMPPQVCWLLPNQLSRAPLTAVQTQRLSNICTRNNHDGATNLGRELSRILGSGDSTRESNLENFGLAVARDMITVPGRVLKSPAVIYRDKCNANVRSGAWSSHGVKVGENFRCSRWTFLRITYASTVDKRALDDRSLDRTIEMLYCKMKELGLDIGNFWHPGLRVSLNDKGHVGKGADPLAGALERFTELSHRSPLSLLLVILPRYDEHLYSRIKMLCDIKKGIRNVCVIESKLARANGQFLANLALKINMKLGGMNQLLDESSLGLIGDGRTMVVGVDVTHPSSGRLYPKLPSVAAMVASVGPLLGQWPGMMHVQPAGQEIVPTIGSLLQSRLRVWQAANNEALPENILVYRDAVADRQYQGILDVELLDMRKACREVYHAKSRCRTEEDRLPRITVVLVGKRHHARFTLSTTKTERFHRREQKQDKNPVAGTVVDRGVTDGQMWDFYLQSHAAPRGIAHPAHYIVIFDEIFSGTSESRESPTDAIQRLTYNMCYLVGRSTNAASICPAVFYADLLCSRGRCYLTELLRQGELETGSTELNLHKNVRDTMFYT
ncbi:hypothetical protein FE257_002701 [Aspergillus nanangensis]|uniref:Piwi domain-containing protein n=1 Tax=Aspergillus nanangensis TaxID=2582783 RepID=A0AAD4GPZ0_ASPNN|nr:hypothetical protein FE257_002701 [Aspergillus nanangensis]